jgi:hypothetical protein
MLPIDQFNTFTTELSQAHDLADAGRVEEGYTLLLLGLRRAEKANEEGMDWGKELVRRYRDACALFAAQSGLGRA